MMSGKIRKNRFANGRRGKPNRRREMSHEQEIVGIKAQIAILEELQADCMDGKLWHIYMRMIDDLNQKLDELTRGIGNGNV